MKKLRFISALLTVIMLLSVCTVAGVSASAVTTSVNGKTCVLGDTITYTVKLKTGQALEDFQGTLQYQSSGLELKSYVMPNTTDRVFYNTNCQDEIPYNGSNITDYYDFTTSKVFLKAVFTVKAEGVYTIKNVLHIMTAADQSSYINNDEVVNNDFSITESTTVAPRLVTGITLKNGSKIVTGGNITLKKGASTTVKAVCSPNSATNKSVTYKSYNTKIAVVNQSGKITAKSKGTTYVRATAKDGSKKYAQCKVTVKQPVTKVTLKKGSKSVTNKTIKIKRNKTVTLKAVVSPTNANVKTVSWSTSNKKVATVTSKGKVKVLKNAKIGKTAVIKVMAKDGSKKSAKCTVKVIK
jgi:uncharacterized protein YjdB